jgi:hypothetical protein
LPSSGGILSEFYIDQLGHSYNEENSEKTVLVHLLVEIINYKKMHGEYKVKFKVVRFLALHTDRFYSPGNMPGTHFC